MRTRWRPRSRSPSLNQSSPPHVVDRLERPPALLRAPPPAHLVCEPGERVQDRVEVWRDVEPEHLDVVADVPDDRQLTRLEHVLQPAREARSADSAGEEDDLHAGTASSERVRRPRRGARRSRSSSVSTSTSSSGIAAVGERRHERGTARRSLAVERREHGRVRQRERVRRAVRGLDEREARRTQAPGSRPGVAAGRSAFTHECVSLERCEPCGDRRAETAAGIGNPPRTGRHGGRVVGHDDDRPDGERRLDDVTQHRERGRGADRRGQAPLCVPSIWHHDRRHRRSVVRSVRGQAAWGEAPLCAPGPDVTQSSRSNQCESLSASAISGSV